MTQAPNITWILPNLSLHLCTRILEYRISFIISNRKKLEAPRPIMQYIPCQAFWLTTKIVDVIAWSYSSHIFYLHYTTVCIQRLWALKVIDCDVDRGIYSYTHSHIDSTRFNLSLNQPLHRKMSSALSLSLKMTSIKHASKAYKSLSLPYRVIFNYGTVTTAPSSTTDHIQTKLPPAFGTQNAQRFREFNLEGRVVAVTGGARGLGLSMAEALMEAGANGISPSFFTGSKSS